MPLDHNIDNFARALSEAPEKFGDEVLEPLGEFVSVRFGRIATERYMQEGPTTFTTDKPARPKGLAGPLRKVSKRLARAVQSTFSDTTGRGGSRETDVTIAAEEQGILFRKVIKVPYAAVHEFGTSSPIRIPTTQQMESFFWAKAYETSPGDVIPDSNAWKHLALAARSQPFFEVSIPARPYAGPALEDVTPLAVTKGEQLIENFLEEQLS